MALLKKAVKKAVKKGAKGAVKKAGGGSSNFELLHPRARKGLPNAGEFVDVQARLAAMGGRWDPDSGAWSVPKDKRPDLEALLNEINFEAVVVPPGMRVATPEDLDTKFAGKKIPPGWVDVMITQDPAAAIQVRGRDSVGRVVTIRAKDADETAAAEKFTRIKLLDAKMPDIDARLDLEAQGDDTAAAVMLVRKMGLRPGSLAPTGAKDQAYGASTLQRRHVEVNGDTVRLRFVGKEGIWNDLSIEDRQLAQVLGSRLLGREGSDPIFPGTNFRKMNTWIGGTAGKGFTSRDFRTHRATGEARMMVAQLRLEQPDLDPRMLELAVGAHVAGVLGNTREEALKTYIDPAVFDSGLAFAPPRSAAQKTAIAKKAWETRRAKAEGTSTPTATATKAPPGEGLSPGQKAAATRRANAAKAKEPEPEPEPEPTPEPEKLYRTAVEVEYAKARESRKPTPEPKAVEPAGPSRPSTPDAVVEAGRKHNQAIQRDPRVLEALERVEEKKAKLARAREDVKVAKERGEQPNYMKSYNIEREIAQAKIDVAAARTTALKDAMSARRSLGGLVKPETVGEGAGDKKLAGIIKRSADDLPADWFDGPAFKVEYSEREAYWDEDKLILVAENEYDAMHELGHAIERSHAPVGDLVRAFYKDRVRDFPLADSPKGYAHHEGAFPQEYMGRYYKRGHTEVLSMTLQQLLRDAQENPESVWDADDSEVRDFVLGLLMEV